MPDSIGPSRTLDPSPLNVGVKSPLGSAKMDAPVVTDKTRFTGSQQGSQIVSSDVSGSKAPPGGKSPSLAKPARMRNR